MSTLDGERPPRPEISFKTKNNAWFLKLGDLEIRLPGDKKAALRRYIEAMADPDAVASRILWAHTRRGFLIRSLPVATFPFQ